MVLIYLPVTTSRTEYVFNLIFKDELGINYQVTTDIEMFISHEGEKINYSDTCITNEFFIKASSLLSEKLIKEINIPVEVKFHTTVLFSNNELCNVGFDIFSAVFYMLSRYEEYMPFIPDKYGRYKATDSLAFRNGFLQSPIVNIWIDHFKNILLRKFPLLKVKSKSFNAIFTYDIDVAYKYKGRNIIRQMGAALKDIMLLRFTDVLERLRTLINIKKDPWDIYDFLQTTLSQNNLNTIFFFLLGDNSQHDKNLRHEQSVMKKLVIRISSFSETGIHPSFKTSLQPERIIIEKKRLEKILNKEIIKSRQHYLKFNLPETYNHLIAAGITEDYSMGFADMPGFRAGTCSPFYFYDLKNEKATALKVFPITFMDGTFIDYMKLSLGEALQLIYKLIEEVKTVNGTFISIWHNHTVSETHKFKTWRDIHNKMLEKILYSQELKK